MNLEKEVEILRIIDHPNLLKLHYVVQDIENIYLLTDYYEDSLIETLENKELGSKICK